MKAKNVSFYLMIATISAALGLGAFGATSSEPANSTPQQVFDGMRQSFQAASHIGPCALEFAVRHRDPIVVTCDERDTRIIDLSLAHLVRPVVHVDPPFATVRAAEFPLIPRVHPLGLVGLETIAH